MHGSMRIIGALAPAKAQCRSRQDGLLSFVFKTQLLRYVIKCVLYRHHASEISSLKGERLNIDLVRDRYVQYWLD